ncbi:MAG TPA: DUF2723 domain-containing protein [Caldilineaceae bacterium]|nr:DUF2723 domain-containing protein [Caldilineaceae bacterium]
MGRNAPPPARSAPPMPAALNSAGPLAWAKQRAALAALILPAGLALLLYTTTAAPGLTWAHYGADGGDLLAAASVNGVPHPTGYPLYTLLLQGWLFLGGVFTTAAPARLGNLLSALCAAVSVGLTVAAAGRLLAPRPDRWLWAAAGGLAWAVTPLLWSQAVITEVYALHTLLITLAGWAALAQPIRRVTLATALALGIAHHLTSLLFWPALAYLLWTEPTGRAQGGWRVWGLLATAWLAGSLFYLRILWAAGADPPPPVNWGYADNLAGLWWLAGGAAYRAYFLDLGLGDLLGRVAAWARVATTQYTPLGLAVALVGLADWDRRAPRLRTFSLLWLAPVSLYAIAYTTVDSFIYLLPVIWLAALWFANGLAIGVDWLQARALSWAGRGVGGWGVSLVALLILAAIGGLAVWRLPSISLHHDGEAETFLSAAAATFEPRSLVISNGDAETFALWYGVWGSKTLAAQVPELVLVNVSLYQFEWYHRLLGDLYPGLPGVGRPFDELLAANRALRPIYTTEPLPELADRWTPQGRFWRLTPLPQDQATEP